MPRIKKYTDLHSAIFKARDIDLGRWKSAWFREHPGKRDVFFTHIQPYLRPQFMLFFAPRTDPLLSFIRTIETFNNLEKQPLDTEYSLFTCPGCGLNVTKLIQATKGSDELCPKCLTNPVVKDTLADLGF